MARIKILKLWHAALTRPTRADFTYHAARRWGSNDVRGCVRRAVAISNQNLHFPIEIFKIQQA